MLRRLALLLALLAPPAAAAAAAAANRSFVVSGQEFLRDGEPVRLISGSFHYFRSPADEWAHRLRLMADCGLNAVQTYVPWNVHEPRPGVYNWEGAADLGAFLEAAGAAGLMVVLRPGPYACAEWDFGGFPSWLLAPGGPLLNGTSASGPRLRTSSPPYLAAVERWWRELLPRVRPHLWSRGGPVVMSQVENEYGSYGSDRAYLVRLRDLTAELLGPSVVIHSTDPPRDRVLEATDVPGVFQTVDFGTDVNATAAFAEQRRFQPSGPLFNSEFYTGWLTHWHDAELQTRPAALVASRLDRVLALGASVNMYMFVGGTNFGYANGANTAGEGAPASEAYLAQITSYDYDSPVRENGTVGAKYAAVCAVVQRHAPGRGSAEAVRRAAAAAAAAGAGAPVVSRSLAARAAASLWDALPLVGGAPLGPGLAAPPTFEETGQAYGYAVHTAPVLGPPANLTALRLRDRAVVYLDRFERGVLERGRAPPGGVPLPGGGELALLAENLGRVNFGRYLDAAGGGVSGVLLGGQFVSNFTTVPLPLPSLDAAQLAPVAAAPPSPGPRNGPAFYVFDGWDADASPVGRAWTRLELPGWHKGSAFVNGFNVGRYWNDAGPQRRLHVPQGVLRAANNSLVIFELHAAPAGLEVTLEQRSLAE